MTCINCDKEVSEKYCSNCGQRTDVKRITFREGWYDFWARIYGFDGMFPRTLRDLTIRPGEAARKYIEGNRALYYGPVGYFFLMITVFLLFMSIVDVDVKEFMFQKMIMSPQQGSGEKLSEAILSFVSENMKIIAFFILPFNAVAARYLLFRKSGLNFLEHLVLPFYVLGHIYWLNIISVIVYKITGSFFMNLIIAIATLLYFGFSYSTFITYQSKSKAFIKGLAVPVMGQLIMTIIIVLAMVLLTVTIPEFREFIRPSNNR